MRGNGIKVNHKVREYLHLMMEVYMMGNGEEGYIMDREYLKVIRVLIMLVSGMRGR